MAQNEKVKVGLIQIRFERLALKNKKKLIGVEIGVLRVIMVWAFWTILI